MDKELIDRVQEFTEQLVALGSLQLDAQISVLDGEVLIDLAVQDKDAVLTDSARLLYAFNHLISQAFFWAANREFRFVVDCDDYRATRTKELEMLASCS